VSRRFYRAQVYEADDTTVDFTIDHDDFKEWPDRFGGQRVNLLEARVESLPFTFSIRSAGFQDDIVANSRPKVLQRRIQFQRAASAGGPWTDVGGGRVQQVDQDQDGGYRIQSIDERWVERNTVIFTEADTCAIWPPRQRLEHDLAIGRRFRIAVSITSKTTEGYAKVDFNRREFTQRVNDLVESDIAAGDEARTLGLNEKRYRHLSLHLDRLVGQTTSVSFKGDYAVRDLIDPTIELPPAIANERTILLDPGNALSPSTDRIVAYFHLPKSPPTEDVPLHVPSDTPFAFRDSRVDASRGVHPFKLVKDIYDGSFQQTIVAGTTKTVSSRTVRYSTQTLSSYSTSNKQGLIDNPRYPIVRYRITESEVMDEFLRRGVFAPFVVMPIIDASGRVRLTDFTLPTAETVGTTALFTFNASNLATAPSWSHAARDQVTSIRFRFPRHTLGVRLNEDDQAVPESNAGMDLVVSRTEEVDARHERLDAGELLRREIIREIPGTDAEAAGRNTADIQAQEMFERYGDGPQESRLAATTAASTVLPGDLVLVNLDAFPNTANSTRGGTVMMQITSRIPRVDGYSFDALHVGAQLQPLPRPTIDVQRSGGDPRHTLRLSVSGYASTNDTAVYQLADSTATPATTDWRNVGTNKAARFLDVGDLKSGTKWWGRARLIRQGRVGSLWSVADSTSTDALAPPTALQSTNQGASFIELSWQNGEDDQVIDVLNPTEIRDTLPVGSNQYRDLGLTAGTTYAYRVRHRDPFGGVSAPTTKLSVSTSTDPNDVLQLTAPDDLRIVFGGNAIQAT